MRIFTYLVLLIIIILGVSFAVLNASDVTLNYYFGTLQLSLSILLVLTLAVGAIIGVLFSLVPLVKLKHKNMRLKAKVKQASQEVENLRAMPIKDNH